ncbi:MAG: hypothetical protein FIB08_17675 [Candidatus Methanoperedens sp.]|nr:hypothetical protein [Candidatus Methanoperedens sp.]
MYETIKIEKVERSCPACEEYSKKHSTNPPKIAVMACEVAEIVVKEHVPEAVHEKVNTKTAPRNNTCKNNKSSCCGD